MNKNVFKNAKTVVQQADTVNDAGGVAYSLSDKAALAQYAVTGTFNGGYYVDETTQYERALKLANSVPTEYLAKVAVYARNYGYMKDMPAFLLAVLATRDVAMFRRAFPLIVDNGKMLRNFVQVMRSGAVGRRSLGSSAKKAVQRWFLSVSDDYLFKASVGNNPSMADVIKLVHPRPQTKSREALYGYLTGRKHDANLLPQIVKDFEAFKVAQSPRDVPNVPFQMLTAQNLTDAEWLEIAKNGNWMFTRMNINTFMRHNVLSKTAHVDMIAKRLSDPTLVKKARAFPYQLYAAYQNTTAAPAKIRNALQDAAESAINNIPDLEGKRIAVLVDGSGSMGVSVTGYRKGATSAVSANDAASLFAAAILRKNPDTTDVFVFDTTARKCSVNPRDSIMTITSKIGMRGGGTDVSCGLELIKNDKYDLVVLLTDMESWFGGSYDGGTKLQGLWNQYRKRNKTAQLVCVNLIPRGNTQATDRSDVLNVGGFSDNLFSVVKDFVDSQGSTDFWPKKIEDAVDLS